MRVVSADRLSPSAVSKACTPNGPNNQPPHRLRPRSQVWPPKGIRVIFCATYEPTQSNKLLN